MNLVRVEFDRSRLPAILILTSALVVLALAAIATFAMRAPADAASASAPAAAAPRLAEMRAAPRPAPARAAAPATPEPLLEVKHILDVPAIAFGDWKWDETGAPAEGRLVMTIDLKAQTISVFRGGHEIGTAAVLYGADDKPTPLGRFPILEKDRDHVSNLYGAPMPFMLRLTTDGVAIHGSSVDEGYATHGCIGVPTPFARKLFAVAKKGDVAVITRGTLLKLGDRIA